MKYYRTLLDISKKLRYISDEENLRGFDEWDFRVGKFISRWDNLVLIKTNDIKCDGVPDDVLQNHLLLPIFSEKMRNILFENDIKDIQYLPIQVFRLNGEPITGYAIANILSVAPALDLERAGYYVIPHDHINVKQRGKIGAIHKFVLHQSKLGDFDIFRLQEHPYVIILSERFVKIYKKHKLTGWVFKEVELS